MTTTIKVTDSAGHVTTQTIDLNVAAPTVKKYLGVYMSGNNSGLDAYTSSWTVKPNIASFYIAWPGSIPSLMTTYAGQGRAIQVELATKGVINGVSGSYVTWANIANGNYDSQIVAFINSLDALPGTGPIFLSLDNEPDIKATSGTGEVQAGQTAAQYVLGANHFADLIHQNSTRVQSAFWAAGTGAGPFLPAHAKLDNVGWDPYKKGTEISDTATTLFKKFIDAVLIPKGYDDIPRHINETGIKVDPFSSPVNGKTSYTYQEEIDFYNGFPAAIAANEIVSVVWFRANSGTHDYIPLDSSVDTAFKNMLASFLS